MAAQEVCLLKPSEYRGEAGTAVVGRIVIKRMQIIKPKEDKGKAKGKGKGDKEKIEIHISGGDTVADVLYAEAWGDAASNLKNSWNEQQCVSIQNADVVQSGPMYSTSRLPYFLRIKAPVGIRTIIREVTHEPWTNIPLFHPTLPLDALTRIEHQQQVCVKVVVVKRLEPITRQTAKGPVLVCNSLVQHGETQIRCAFWRSAATALGAHDDGVGLLLEQVVVKRSNGGWELTATDATTIKVCSEEVAEELRWEMRRGGTPTCITKMSKRDWSTCAAFPCSLSALVTAIVPGQVRKLGNVYFAHNLQIMGISACRQDSDAWYIHSCETCKRQMPCDQHKDAKGENRWLLKIQVADGHVKHEFVAYHDQIQAALPELSAALDSSIQGNDVLPELKMKILQAMRSQPWSAKFIFRENEYSNSNELDCRLMVPTVTTSGEVLECCPTTALPIVAHGTGCPLASPAKITYDKELGIMKVDNTICAPSVRMFVRVSNEDLKDEEAVQQDPHSPGLRIKRLVCCGLTEDTTKKTVLTVAGPPSAVNWLSRAAANSMFCIVAMSSGVDDCFIVNWHASITGPHADKVLGFAKAQYRLQQGHVLDFTDAPTPTKRVKAIEEESNLGEMQGAVTRNLFLIGEPTTTRSSD